MSAADGDRGQGGWKIAPPVDAIRGKGVTAAKSARDGLAGDSVALLDLGAAIVVSHGHIRGVRAVIDGVVFVHVGMNE